MSDRLHSILTVLAMAAGVAAVLLYGWLSNR